MFCSTEVADDQSKMANPEIMQCGMDGQAIGWCRSMLEVSFHGFPPPDRVCTSAFAVSDVPSVAFARTSCLTAHAATAMRPSGRIATSTSTSDSLAYNSACFRSTSSPCRPYWSPHSQAACAYQRSASDSGHVGGLFAAAGLRICRPSRWHAKQSLQEAWASSAAPAAAR